MNKTLETQNSKGLSGKVNPVPGDLLMYVYDAEYFLIEDMPLYLVIDKKFVRGTKDYLWCVEDKDMYCFSMICNNASHISHVFEAVTEAEDNQDVVLKFYVRLSDLLPLND
jgi:hypothetical protein